MEDLLKYVPVVGWISVIVVLVRVSMKIGSSAQRLEEVERDVASLKVELGKHIQEGNKALREVAAAIGKLEGAISRMNGSAGARR